MKTRIGLSLLLLAFLTASVALMGCPPAEDTEAPMMDEPPMEDMPMDDEATGPEGEGGTIEIIGSTTVLPVATAWAEAYHEENPDVDLNVSGGGSGNGIKALIDGTADIADASRQIKPSEVELAEENGIDPVEHTVAYDGIAPIVHPDNPVESLTIQQLSDIYSGEVSQWSEVGVTGMANDDIVVVSRDSASGTYESWKEMVIQMDGEAEDRDYSPAALKKGSNKDVRQTVADTSSAIGYIGLGYLDDSIKTVSVVPMDGGDAVAPTHENVQDGSYPVSRGLYMYTDGEPTGIVADFIDWGMSEEGQALVEEEGFVPVK
jgi:phosphate transport system substrate-binding protein